MARYDYLRIKFVYPIHSRVIYIDVILTLISANENNTEVPIVFKNCSVIPAVSLHFEVKIQNYL